MRIERERQGLKILVVDDDAAICSLAGACIRHALGESYRVSYARNGKKALEAVQRDHPDLVLLDILMPVMDGFEVCRQLKSTPGTDSIPILFLTALGEDANIEKGLALGGDGYVIKPFNAVALAAQITELLVPPDER
ncbi:MAG: response regulator [Armatimonadota bacterium]|jgi:putative two-component system response regulator